MNGASLPYATNPSGPAARSFTQPLETPDETPAAPAAYPASGRLPPGPDAAAGLRGRPRAAWPWSTATAAPNCAATAEGQRWVAGERGHRYAVRLYNDSPRRVLVVLSVDGVNAISGEDADPSQTGYVLNPDSAPTSPAGARARTKWRSSSSAAPAAAMPAAPAAPTTSAWWAWPCSRKRAAGALSRSCAGACHRRPRLHRPKRRRCQRHRGLRQQAAGAGAGTGHGAREQSSVRDTEFERASRSPAQVLQLRYDAPATCARAASWSIRRHACRANRRRSPTATCRTRRHADPRRQHNARNLSARALCREPGAYL